MKKALLIFSAVLLLAGCAKEKFANLKGGELTDVTITAQMPNEIGTRAVADGDGAAANVNRCIMEVYYGDDLFTRMYAPVDAQKKASFTLQVVSNRTYQIVFWADHVASSASEDGLNTDLYYTTNAADGLKAIALKGTYAGNDDARDAFFYSGDYTVEQGGSSFNVTLKRPFAQVNVITTDASLVRKSADLKPTKVKVVLNQAMTAFNAMTGAVSTPADLTYVADAYKTDYTADEVTLAMDYLFAAATKELIDIDFKAGRGDFESGDNTFVSHSFSSVPYQRNYRTNIKGALLTAVGKWNVTVDPVWESSQAGNQEIVYEVVNDIAGANTVIASELASGNKEISVKFTSQPNDAGTPGSASGDIINKAIVTTNLPSDGALNILVEAQTKDLYIGDYQSETNTTVVTSGTNAAVVNVNIPTGSGIQKLVINAPSKTVYLNGIQVASAGEITDIDAIVSNNTLVIENGQTIGTLTIRKGGLEIHGTVNTAVVIPENDQAQVVFVRDCENLSQSVYNVLQPYIDVNNGYTSAQNSDQTWNIFKKLVVKNTTTNVLYTSISDAVNEAVSGETLQIVDDIVKSEGKIIFPENKVLTLDLNGHTVKAVGDNMGRWSEVNGKLTVTGAGYLGDDTHSVCGYLFHVYGELVLDATATFESGLEVAESRSAESKIYVHKGHYIGDKYDGRTWTFNKKDTYATSAVIEIDGGSFVEFDPSNANTEAPVQNWVKAGYVSISNGATPPVFSVVPAVAKLTKDGDESFAPKYYSSVNAGISDYNSQIAAAYTLTIFDGEYSVNNATINQAVNKTLTVTSENGNTKTTLFYGGSGDKYLFEINGASSYSTGGILIKDLKFDLKKGASAVWAQNSTTTRYANDVVLSGCDFVCSEGTRSGYLFYSGSGSGPINMTAINCTANNINQVASGYFYYDDLSKPGIVIKNVTLSGCKAVLNNQGAGSYSYLENVTATDCANPLLVQISGSENKAGKLEIKDSKLGSIATTDNDKNKVGIVTGRYANCDIYVSNTTFSHPNCASLTDFWAYDRENAKTAGGYGKSKNSSSVNVTVHYGDKTKVLDGKASSTTYRESAGQEEGYGEGCNLADIFPTE